MLLISSLHFTDNNGGNPAVAMRFILKVPLDEPIMTRKLSVWAGLNRNHLLPSICFGVLMLLVPVRLFAALGGDAASVQSDQVHMQANLRTTRSEAYIVHELRSATGIAVREYVSPSGTVFGVAWEGPWLPDMRQILGAYFEPYVQAMQSQRAGRPGRQPVHVELPGLVVHVEGHPRAFSGHAYIPGTLPEGMSDKEIR